MLAGEDGTGEGTGTGDSRAWAGAVAELSAGQLDAGGVGAGQLGGVLREALDGFDEPGAQAALDRLFSDLW